MANIYEKQAVSDFSNKFYSHEGNSGQWLMKEGEKLQNQGEKTEDKAKETYATALKVDATSTMNELYSKYSDDPVKLDEAFKKTYDKVSGEIVDDDVKINFLADVSLKRQAYITKAIENKKRKDYRIAKSITFDSIDADTETIGLAFSNAIGDEFNPDNAAAYGKSLYDAGQKINTLNDDGTFMFSDEQRRQKDRNIDRAHYIALRGNFRDMPAYQKKSYLEKLNDDDIYVPVGVDENNNIVRKNLQDVVTQETYEKFKDYANRVSKRKGALGGMDDDEAYAIAEQQTTNAVLIDSELSNIKELQKDKPSEHILDNLGVKKGMKDVESVLRNLELQYNMDSMGENELAKGDRKTYKKQAMEQLIGELKKKEDTFDDALIQESAMSVGLQAMKHDGKIGGKAWSDDMSVVMIRDFYSMAKEMGLDLRATDSASRDAAKKLSRKAIENTIERVAGGYGKEYNSLFLSGRKVSKSRLSDEQYNNPDYTVENGKKKYNETQIEVDL